MKLTTKGLADISVRQDISLSYLEQLFSKLRKRGLVTSMRGPGGGYSLSREPKEIAMSSIILAVDESVDVTSCNGKSDCQDSKRCLTHDLWADLSGRIQSFLDDISLEDMMNRKEVLAVAARQNRKAVTEATLHNLNG